MDKIWVEVLKLTYWHLVGSNRIFLLFSGSQRFKFFLVGHSSFYWYLVVPGVPWYQSGTWYLVPGTNPWSHWNFSHRHKRMHWVVVGPTFEKQK